MDKSDIYSGLVVGGIFGAIGLGVVVVVYGVVTVAKWAWGS